MLTRERVFRLTRAVHSSAKRDGLRVSPPAVSVSRRRSSKHHAAPAFQRCLRAHPSRFVSRCAQVPLIDSATSPSVRHDGAMVAADGSGVSLPPVGVAHRRSVFSEWMNDPEFRCKLEQGDREIRAYLAELADFTKFCFINFNICSQAVPCGFQERKGEIWSRSSRHPAARALLARSPVAFCFCCAQVQPPRNSAPTEQQSQDRAASEGREEFSLPAAAASEQQAPSDTCTPPSHSPCPSTCTSTSTSTEEVSTIQDVNGMFDIRGYPRSRPSVARPPTNRSQPRITVQRSAARDEDEMRESLKVQFNLELEINHGPAIRQSEGVWASMDAMRLAREVFHPAIDRVFQQSCAWVRTSHKRKHDRLATLVPPPPNAGPTQPAHGPNAGPTEGEPPPTLLPHAFRPLPCQPFLPLVPASCASAPVPRPTSCATSACALSQGFKI